MLMIWKIIEKIFFYYYRFYFGLLFVHRFLNHLVHQYQSPDDNDWNFNSIIVFKLLNL